MHPIKLSHVYKAQKPMVNYLSKCVPFMPWIWSCISSIIPSIVSIFLSRMPILIATSLGLVVVSVVTTRKNLNQDQLISSSS